MNLLNLKMIEKQNVKRRKQIHAQSQKKKN